MVTSISNSILAKAYADANDLAQEMSRFFNGGLNLNTFNLTSIDGRYARLVADNEFIGDQSITGKVTVEGAAVAGNALVVRHAGTGALNAVHVEATAAAGGLTVKRDVSSGAGDHLVRMSENVSAFNVLNISSAGTGSAVYIDHTGASGYGLEVNARGIRVNGGGLVVSAGGMNIVAGGATISGTISLQGATTVTTGGLNVSAGGAAVTGGLTVTNTGLTVSAGGSNVTGNSQFNNTLGVSGLLTASAGISVSGNVSGVTTLTTTTTNTTNLTVSGATISVNGFTFTTTQINYIDWNGPTNMTKRFLVV